MLAEYVTISAREATDALKTSLSHSQPASYAALREARYKFKGDFILT